MPETIKRYSKKTSESIDLFREQRVAGNISEKSYQAYHIYYYPVDEKKRRDKIRLSLYLKPKEKGGAYERTSIYFVELPQLRNFILNCIKSYFKWLINRIEPQMPKERLIEYRNDMLKGFVNQIMEEVPGIWREREEKEIQE